MEENEAIYGQHERLALIGKFYVELAWNLLGGNKNILRNDDEGDIQNFELDVKLEVKGSAVPNPFAIRENQLDAHLACRGFPLSNCWYCLFSYKNRPRRISSVTPDRYSLNRFLARHTRTLHVLDATVIGGIRMSYGVKNFFDTTAVKMGQGLLHRFETSPRHFLFRIGLDPRAFLISHRGVSVRLKEYDVKFGATFVILNSLRERTKQTLFEMGRNGAVAVF